MTAWAAASLCRMRPAPTRIAVFGDSHAALFFRGGLTYPQLGIPRPVPYDVVRGGVITGGSVAGFRPGDSKLDVKGKVLAQLPRLTHLVLAFGQVDLELGYYYRLAVKGEQTTPEEYVAWLAKIYRTYLEDLETGDCRVALKGVNPTALVPKGFAARYVSRIVLRAGESDPAAAVAAVTPYILRQDDQNAMHYAFNATLRGIARDLDMAYFDLVDALTEPNPTRGGPPRLSDLHRRAADDHHVANTVWVRRRHWEAAGAAFGLR